MPSLERRAWFHLGIVGLAIVVWLVIFMIWESVEGSMAAFAVLGLTGLWPNRFRALLNERDREIAESSLNIGVRWWLVCSTIIPIAIGSVGGWERTVSIAMLAQSAWLAWLLVLTVQAVATIYKYRAARYA